MEKQQVCCCGSSGWTRVIGWFQIVSAVALILERSLFFIKNLNDLTEPSLKLHSINFSVSVITIKLVFYLFSFIMGIVLLLGSYNRNTRHIFAWMVYTAVFIFMFTINAIFECIEAQSWVQVAGNIISILLALAIHRFCLWVVAIHESEIEALTKDDSFDDI